VTVLSVTLSRRGALSYQLTVWSDGVARRDAAGGPLCGAWQGRVEARGFVHVAALVERLACADVEGGDVTIVIEGDTGHRSVSSTVGRESDDFWHVATLLDGVSANTTWAPLDVTGAKDLNPWAGGTSVTLSQGSCLARGLATEDGLVVLAGSIVSPSTAPTLEPNYKRERTQLLEAGDLIIGENDRCVLGRHLWFGSPSAAASVVAGSNTNGRKAWRDQVGRPWSEVFP